MTDLCVANLMSVSTGPAHVERIARKALALDADGYLFTEAQKVDLAAIVPEGWVVTQHGALGSPESSLAIVTRPGVRHGRSAMRRGTPKGGRGRKRVRRRGILSGYVNDVRVNNGHGPLPATGLNVAFMRALRRLLGSKFGDTNRPHGWMVKFFGRRFDVHSAGVLHAVIPKRRRSTVVARISGRDLAGADHAALIVRVPPL